MPAVLCHLSVATGVLCDRHETSVASSSLHGLLGHVGGGPGGSADLGRAPRSVWGRLVCGGPDKGDTVAHFSLSCRSSASWDPQADWAFTSHVMVEGGGGSSRNTRLLSRASALHLLTSRWPKPTQPEGRWGAGGGGAALMGSMPKWEGVRR